MYLHALRGSDNRSDEVRGGGLAQIYDEYMHMPKGALNRLNPGGSGGGLAQIVDCYMHMPKGCNNRLNVG